MRARGDSRISRVYRAQRRALVRGIMLRTMRSMYPVDVRLALRCHRCGYCLACGECDGVACG